MKTSLCLVLGVLAVVSVASADAGPDPRVELRERITELEQENETLRRQWGQATIELDRLRKELAEARAQLGRQNAAAEAGAGVSSSAATASPGASLERERGAALEAELERLRRQNEDLQAQQAQLTQLAGLAPAGDRVASGDARITTETEGGQVVVRTVQEPLRMLRGSRADHVFSLAYAYDEGSEPSLATPVRGYFQAAFSGGIYSRAGEVVLTVDGGETVQLPITDRSTNLRQTNVAGKRRLDKSDETLTVLVTPDALRRLARASSATGRIGEVVFELTRDQLALFTAIHARLDKGM